MHDLLPLAVAESSAGGLGSAALLAQPGASAYFLGGAVVYPNASRDVFLDLPQSALDGIRPATEAYALLVGEFRRPRTSLAKSPAERGQS
jgi:nicotinamide-nucleotide amidase